MGTRDTLLTAARFRVQCSGFRGLGFRWSSVPGFVVGFFQAGFYMRTKKVISREGLVP